MPLVIVLDESDVVRKIAKRILTGINHDVYDTASINDAVARALQQMPDYVILDSKMDGANDAITSIRAMPGGADVRIFYCVVKADLKAQMAGRRAGADAILLKPFDRDTLIELFSSQTSAALSTELNAERIKSLKLDDTVLKASPGPWK